MNQMTWMVLGTPENARNSEGDFQRDAEGRILFAYSRYYASTADEAPCDIAMIFSEDEGETWSDVQIIAHAADFGVKNIMCASALPTADGKPAFYFLIKENDGNTTLGRTVLEADGTWHAMRCAWNVTPGYYVVENARLRRFPDGTVYAPGSLYDLHASNGDWRGRVRLFRSRDDGATFEDTDVRLSFEFPDACANGLQEPGIEQLPDGRAWIYARTAFGCQYQSFAPEGTEDFCDPIPSFFTAPLSPMATAYAPDGKLYAVYNPTPNYDGRENGQPSTSTRGRTPLAIRRSADGVHFGTVTLIEKDPTRCYCYPSLFFTRDEALLCAYCCGPDLNGGSQFTEFGIRKVSLSELKDEFSDKK